MSSACSLSCDKLTGEIVVPGDKSISHRALILASQAIGETKISGLLEGEDVLNTLNALKNLGVNIKKKNNLYFVDGVGAGGLIKPSQELNLGNSGTGVRLLIGLTAPYDFNTTFTGDVSLKNRPMNRIISPLKKMGVQVKYSGEGELPLSVKGGYSIHPIEYALPVPSAQVKSAILLAALNIPGKTTVIEKELTRDHTEIMMNYLGINIEKNNYIISIIGQQEFAAKNIDIPGDPSSAAFVAVAALIVPNSEVTINNVCMNPLRTGIYKTLIEMGGDIIFLNVREQAGERVADIRVRHSKLNGVEVPAERAPSMIDEYPILSIAASVAEGKTTMHGLQELKIKESNRLSAIEGGLGVCGIQCNVTDNSLSIKGGKSQGGEIKTHMDHRIAMSFLVLGMVSKNSVTIDDDTMISTSFPDFMGLMNLMGGNITIC